MQIIKLGGSLYNTPELKQWLIQLHQLAQSELTIIVPGGGPFANLVRDTQQRYRFAEKHAHHMAILAMAQYGLLVHGLSKESQLFYYPNTSNFTPFNGLHIWVPDSSLLAMSELKKNWDITSDSLALWLAQQLPTSQLYLIKRAQVTTNAISELTQTKVLDNGFASLFKQQTINSQIIHYQHFNGLDKNETGHSLIL